MNLDAVLARLAEEPGASVDLAEVALALARDEYPTLDTSGYLAEFDAMAHDARLFLGSTFDSQITGLCRYLFHEAGFHGNRDEYYDPRNSFLNDVLDRQTGIPITLSVVAMAVGERLGLRIDGLGLPGHFVVMAGAGKQRIIFDPFHGGKRLDLDDCAVLVQQSAGLDIEWTPDLLQPAPAGVIVTRMLSNLKGAYLRVGDFRRAARTISRIIQIAPEDWIQRRDLGTCLFQSGRAGSAIDHFAAYLEAVPEAIDAEAVEKLLRQARREVAKWN
jgi:regulator of sirC expression with transglutaminase-like and TPR domain